MITSLFVIAMTVWGTMEKGVGGFFAALFMSILVAVTVKLIIRAALTAYLDRK